MASRASQFPFSLKTPAIITSKYSHFTAQLWLYWSFLSFLPSWTLSDWVCTGYQTVIQSEDWIRANSSITLSPFHSLYALSHIAKEYFIIAKIPWHFSLPSCKLSPRKLLCLGDNDICHMAFMYHSHLSCMHSWTTYELGTEIFPPTFRNSFKVVTSCESFHVTLCVYWMDKSISTSQFWLVRKKMSSRDSGGRRWKTPPVFWGLVWVKI